MTYREPHPCAVPGCPLTTRDYYCFAHIDPEHTAARFRSTDEWQDLRARFIRQHPTCCDPFHVHGDALALTRVVHHVQPVATRPDLAFTETNLRALCHRCHGRVNALERGGQAGAAIALFTNPSPKGPPL